MNWSRTLLLRVPRALGCVSGLSLCTAVDRLCTGSQSVEENMISYAIHLIPAVGALCDGSQSAEASAPPYLQAVARAEPKALHPHWLTLLPAQTPSPSRASFAPTLADIMLYDPNAEVFDRVPQIYLSLR